MCSIEAGHDRAETYNLGVRANRKAIWKVMERMDE